MPTAHQLGQMAEDLAADFYKKRGYTLLARNYRYQKAEVDLIVRKANVLVAVEVKARSTTYFGRSGNFHLQYGRDQRARKSDQLS